METSITIENSGRRSDVAYTGCLCVFWLIWTPVTIGVTYLAYSDFHIFFVIWLLFGYLGVFGVPWTLIQSRRPQRLVATEQDLIIDGGNNPFQKIVRMPRNKVIKLYFGHYDDGEVEAVVTLNLFSGAKRVMISQLSHPTEKREIFETISKFLEENEFNVEIEDTTKKK